jgi:hypothetical protein
MNKSIAAIAVVALSACGVSESFDAESEASLERNDRAGIQIVHLSPDAPEVDILVNGATRALSDVPYLGATGLIRVRPGVYGMDIVPAGGAAPGVISADLEFESRVSYTIVAWDELASIKPAVLVNDLGGIPDGFIRLQVTHTAVGVGTVDVWDLGSGVKVVDDFEFGATGVLDVPAGALDVGLDLDEDGEPDVSFSVPDLGADTLVNVFPIADDVGVALYALFLDGTTARVDAD